ncbi:MAG: RecX family transcriptional regulator [Phototrophicaceae bacterium]|jgi:regulatory protein
MPAGKITSLEIQVNNKERVNVYLDGEYGFSLALMAAATLRKGQVLTEAEVARLGEADHVSKATDAALRFLGVRPRSRHEVNQRLTLKGYDPAKIEAALNQLEQMGYLNDADFARYWVENRDTFKPRSPSQLRMELRQKGVADAIINDVLAPLDATDAAYRAALAKLTRYKGLPYSEWRQRLGAFLMRRGFGYSTVAEVLAQIKDELEVSDPDYFDLGSDSDADGME